MNNNVGGYRAYIVQNGFLICTPISGSMRPMIRVRKDSVLFVVPKKRLQVYDVGLFSTKEGLTIMHRVIKVLPEGYIFRGDNSNTCEYVKEEQIIGVMKGFYRGEKYYDKNHIGYKLYGFIWVRLHPLLMIYKKIKRKLCFIFR